MRLTEERWSHVTAGHPEMEGQKERALEALSEPDMIQEGDLVGPGRDQGLRGDTGGCKALGGRLPRGERGGRVRGHRVPDPKAVEREGSFMDEAVVKILEKPADIRWDYDEEADVLYLSIGERRPAESVDVGEGVIVRYDEAEREVAGITLLGLRARLLRQLDATRAP